MKNKRCFYVICSAVLFAAEILIGMFADGFIRGYVGDILVVPLIYALIRTVSPDKPQYNCMLPTIVTLFAFAVEIMQSFAIADILGIRNTFLRTLIGTSFSFGDILCYIIGAVSLYLYELHISKRT